MFLSDYERKLEITELALDEEAPLPDEVLMPFVAPEGLGPIPASLEGRCLKILQRNVEVEQRLRNELETLGRELGQVTRMGDGAQRFGNHGVESTPTYLDHSV